MTTLLIQAIDQCMHQALATGALQPIQFQAQQIKANNMGFKVCWIPALSIKQNIAPTGFPSGKRDPNFNPFLPPDPILTVGKLGDYHHAVLNKFPVCKRHLVIPRVDFADQRSPLQYEDFLALTLILSETDGLGFYNGGTVAGASQHHLHLQWLPDAPENASLLPFVSGLDTALAQQGQQQRDWTFEHIFMYTRPSADAYKYARELYQSYQLACRQLKLTALEDGLMPPMNMLIQDGWLLIVPRSQEYFGQIPLNALSFAGMIYVREKEHIDQVREKGVMQVLAAVAT